MSIVFASRTDAAHKLAKALAKFHGRNPLVLAIPRGAVEMGRVLADALEGEIDVVLVRKLRSPQSAEFAVGAIDETGWANVADYAASAGADDAYLAHEKRDQLELLRKRRALYTPARPPIDPKGRVVIVVDDGLATGLTMIAALRATRARGAAWTVCAVPVASPRGIARVRPWCDEIVALATPHDFYGVSVFYEDFRQVGDDEVVRLLGPRAVSAPG
jgi:predicted phosphoribosyltransferase